MSATQQGLESDKAISPAQAALQARAQKMGPQGEKAADGLLAQRRRKSKFPQKELIKFCRGMASMLKAQINTSDAIKYYAQGHPSAEIKKTLMEVKDLVDSGAPTYVAFAKTNKFDDKFISLVRAGSDSGQIHKAFEAISHRLKKEAVFKAKMRKATILPSLIICALIGLFIIAQLKIVPEVEGLLLDVKQEPDGFSAKLFTISHVVKKVWLPFIIIFGSTIASFLFLEKVKNFVINMTMSKWRLVRQLVMGMRQMLFLGTLNMLHANGITLAKSIDIAAASLKGTPMYQELIDAGRRYQASGLPFSEAIRKFTSCDAQVAHMIGIGERSSSLDAQLEMLTNMYEEEVNQYVDEFTGAINFVTLVIAALLIAVVFIGAFLPIFLMGPKMMNSAM